MSMLTRWLAFLFFLNLILIPASAEACSIPVFRYALERWQPSFFEATLFHRGDLTPELRALIKQIEEPTIPVNLRVTPCDVTEKMSPDEAKLWESQGSQATLPWLVVRFMNPQPKSLPLWAGPANKVDLPSLVDSPMRRQILDLLCQGDSTVFLLLESGDPLADEKALTLLEEERTRLVKAILLPEPSEVGPQLRFSMPLRVSLPILRLKRNDPQENLLLRMLFEVEEGLDKIKGPQVFLLFGRGRCLCSLYGEDLDSDELERAVRFLCGACSCQVKELNPGVDMLFAADWEARLEANSKAAADTSAQSSQKPQSSPPPTPSSERPVSPRPESRPREANPPTTNPDTTGINLNRTYLWIGIGFASALVLITGCWVLLTRRAESDQGPTP